MSLTTYILCGGYIAAILAANMTATWFIGPLAVGTLFFGAVFTLRDRLHHAAGRRAVYVAVALAAFGSALVAAGGGAPWRVVLASVVGLVAGKVADTEVYHRTAGAWLRRVAASNAVSIPVDTLAFNLLAFAGDLPWPFIVALSVTDILIKAVSSGVVAWFRPSSTVPGKMPVTQP